MLCAPDAQPPIAGDAQKPRALNRDVEPLQTHVLIEKLGGGWVRRWQLSTRLPRLIEE